MKDIMVRYVSNTFSSVTKETFSKPGHFWAELCAVFKVIAFYRLIETKEVEHAQLFGAVQSTVSYKL